MQKITLYLIYLTVALIPLFFFPSTVIIQELPKQAILTLLISVAFIIWLTTIVLSKNIKLNRSVFDIFVLGFWATQIISTIGSVHSPTSIWGSYGQSNLSLLTTTLFVAFYFIVVNNIRIEKELNILIGVLLASSALTAVFSIFNIAGYSIIPFSAANARGFNTIGSPNGLVMFLIPILVLAVALLTRKKAPLRISLSILVILLSGLLIAININNLWWGLLAALAVTVVVVFIKKDTDKKWLLVPLILIFISVAMFFSVNFGLPVDKDISLNNKVSNTVTFKTLKNNAAFGSGPETFSFDFSLNKPKSINKTPFWSLRFSRASNDYLTVLSTTGILGLAAYLALFVIAFMLLISSVIKRKEAEDFFIGIGLLSALAALAVNSLLFYTNTASAFLIWMIFSLSVIHYRKDKEPLAIKTGLIEARVFAVVFLIITLFMGITGIYSQVKALAADVKYKQGLENALNIKTLNKAQQDLKKAVSLNPRIDNYSLAIARIQLIKANREGQKKKPNTKLLRGYITEAIKRGKYVTQISPMNVADWEAQAIIYRNAALYVSGALPLIESSYLNAINLEPVNPLLYNGLGQVYLTQKKYEEAVKVFKLSVDLKDDLADSYFNLGLAYKGLKQYSKAIAQFNKVIKLQPNNEEAKKQKKNIRKTLSQKQILKDVPSQQRLP